MSILRNFIKESIHEYLNEQQMLKESWYHGTPDAREVEENGGFTDRTKTISYVTDPKKFDQHREKMNLAMKNGDMDTYDKLLNMTGDFKKDFTYKKPIFLCDKYSVAKTYADPKRAFDYQNALEKVYEVDIECDKIAKIVATGDRFRFVSIDKVRQGFINSGVSSEEIDKLIGMFNYYISDNKGIQTDVIAAIGNYLGFDCIDVIGVLDSYDGGTVKSTVRMVLNPSNVKIKRNER